MAYISAYKDRPIKKWTAVAAAYRELTGESVEAEPLRLKLRTMKERYRRLIKWNDTSGNDAKPVPEELEDAFGMDAAVESATVESSQVEGQLIICILLYTTYELQLNFVYNLTIK